MITAGCDVGSLTVKAVVLEDRQILGYEIIPATVHAVESSRQVMDKLLERLKLSYEDIDFCVSTGYGRRIIPFAQANVSEISCHARGAHFLVPSARTIIDMGGQDYKAISVGEDGRLQTFLMNDKCAAGTGRSMEIAAESLGVDISQLGSLSLDAGEPVKFVFVCSSLIAVEVRQMVLEGEDRANIAAGVNDLTTRRVASLVHRLPPEEEVVATGGGAKNVGVRRGLERKLGMKLVSLPEDPQIVGALGAAVLAAKEAREGNCCA
jgi:predicted CoA-substrate-specific enzyme activase